MFEQERLLSRLQQQVRSAPSIAACFLTGSYGRREADAWSDLDIVLGYLTPLQRDSAWTGREEFARSLSPYVPLHCDDGDVPFTMRAVFGNGAQADFRFIVLNEARPTWDDRHIRVLKDYQGWAERFQGGAERGGLAPIPINEARLAAIDSRFWVLYWDVLRQVLRRDHAGPFVTYLELLNSVVAPLLAALPPADPARAPLLATRFDQDIRATHEQLRALLQAYLKARQALMDAYNLRLALDERFEKAILELVDKKTPGR